MKKNSFKGISKRAKLLLDSEETYDIEFKKNAQNLKGEDFAAFANSRFGGAILIGVEEYNDKMTGRQKTKIVGCPIGDEAKRSLNSKAQQCSPPIEIEIFIENENKTPFYRVEIPSGKNKPYCSSGGTYKIRKDGQKESLLPQDLLQLFMVEESGKFLQKFKESTIELRNELYGQNDKIKRSIIDSTRETESNVFIMLSEMEDKFLNISDELKETEKEISQNLYQLNDENQLSNKYQEEIQNNLYVEVDTANKNIINLAWKLNALLEKFGIEDPEITVVRKRIQFMISEIKGIYKSQNKKVTKKLIKDTYIKYSKRDKIIPELFTYDDFEKWFKEIEASDTFEKYEKK